MCGRYSLEDNESNLKVQELLGLVRTRYDGDPRLEDVKTGEIYPSNTVVILQGTGPYPMLAKWGLQGFGPSQLLINARAETAAAKPTFKRLVQSTRCLFVANSFYEWQKIGATDSQKPSKQKYALAPPEEPLFYMAGLYKILQSSSEYPEGKIKENEEEADRLGLPPLPLACILTTDANGSMSDIHDRMPLILNREEAQAWLTDTEAAMELLQRPCNVNLERSEAS